MKAAFLVFSLTTLLTSGIVFAQGPDKSTDSMKGMNMEGMDMKHMSTMNNECMKEHKDKKMCHDQMMKKCEEKMSEGDCNKMMKDMGKMKHK